MIFRQLFHQDSGTYSYLLAGRAGGEAMLIDPVLDRADRYMKLLEELDLKLVKVVDTHVHADHITAMGELRDRTKCVTVMGEAAPVDVVSMRVKDGDMVTIEGVQLETLYTPGHTIDSYCFKMADRVFTGDTLLIRGSGRTDFQSGDSRSAYESIFTKLLTLPDNTLVYPGHDYKGDTVSTIGEEKAFNPRLQVASADEYAAIMDNLNLADPKQMDVAVPANIAMGLGQSDAEHPDWALTVGQLMALQERTSVALVDLREDSERASDGQIPGSIHAPYGSLSTLIGSGG
ncbi:MAG: Beta-lactamase hydrolase-like protein, partial [Alphaproteobacteria bacterium MarineAlpha10_Bin1]